MARAKSGSLPSYRKHKSTGQAVVTIGARDVYLGSHGTKESKAEYARVHAEFLTTGSVSTKTDLDDVGESITVVQILAAYWNNCTLGRVMIALVSSSIAA